MMHLNGQSNCFHLDLTVTDCVFIIVYYVMQIIHINMDDLIYLLKLIMFNNLFILEGANIKTTFMCSEWHITFNPMCNPAASLVNSIFTL